MLVVPSSRRCARRRELTDFDGVKRDVVRSWLSQLREMTHAADFLKIATVLQMRNAEEVTNGFDHGTVFEAPMLDGVARDIRRDYNCRNTGAQAIEHETVRFAL